MIILDLEWNRGYDKKPIEEILHIGAVKIDHVGGPIVDTFNSYIKPVIHAKMDIGARCGLPRLASGNISFTFSIEISIPSSCIFFMILSFLVNLSSCNF